MIFEVKIIQKSKITKKRLNLNCLGTFEFLKTVTKFDFLKTVKKLNF